MEMPSMPTFHSVIRPRTPSSTEVTVRISHRFPSGLMTRKKVRMRMVSTLNPEVRMGEMTEEL